MLAKDKHVLIGVPHKYNYVVIAAKMYLIANAIAMCLCPNFGVYIYVTIYRKIRHYAMCVNV